MRRKPTPCACSLKTDRGQREGRRPSCEHLGGNLSMEFSRVRLSLDERRRAPRWRHRRRRRDLWPGNRCISAGSFSFVPSGQRFV